MSMDGADEGFRSMIRAEIREALGARARIRREQRRYEIARDVMAGFSTRQGFCDYIKDWTGDAVLAADALLAALEAK